MTATILLIRHAAHGALDRQLTGRMSGIELSDDGRAQARGLAASLAREPIDRIDTSPLERTAETATAIAAARGGMQPRPVDLLVEIDLGDWTGRRFDTLAGDPQWDAWNEHRGSTRVPGGESMAEAQARIVRYLSTVAKDDAGRMVAAVTHSDMIRAAVAHIIGLPLDNLLRFDIDPASVTRVVVGDWGGKLLSLNERLW